ncbi:sugar transferase [Sphingobacterium sp. PU5-4]|uniref:Sugar transferase n=1 Tax=Sphingobacterium tenebrionis TaxID=3111775 RepID=A0ABU8I2R6_9SPHI
MIDLSISAIALFLFTPIFLIILIWLAIANNGKPFFFQTRPGLNGNLFKIIKFKTMNDKRDSQGNLLPDSERMTRIGNLVRKTSLDELPQLINVIKGDMALVGPRPLLPQYIPLYSEVQRRRHDVRPGITGWAQVNGRNAINWTRKFELDVWYVENLSFRLDIKIILLTIKKVFIREGISADGHATTDGFNGYN